MHKCDEKYESHLRRNRKLTAVGLIAAVLAVKSSVASVRQRDARTTATTELTPSTCCAYIHISYIKISKYNTVYIYRAQKQREQ